VNGHFTLNSVLFSSSQVQNLLIYLYGSLGKAIISILSIDNIFGEGHMYQPEVCSVYCTKLLNILRLGIFNNFGLLKSFQRVSATKAYCLNVQYT